jgi:hypothetical protein
MRRAVLARMRRATLARMRALRTLARMGTQRSRGCGAPRLCRSTPRGIGTGITRSG